MTNTLKDILMKGPGKKGTIIVLVLLCIIMMIHAMTYRSMVDDSFISFRYAQNLSEGNGLVFNVGEHVEGYTDFLWVLLLSFFYTLGLPIPIVSQVLGIAAAMCVVPLVYVAGRICCKLPRGVALLVALTLSLTASVAVWAGSGLETTLYMTLFTAALLLFIIEMQKNSVHPLSGILFALATLTRPEGAGMFAVAVIVALLLRAGPVKIILKNVLAFSLIIVPHEIFRIAYYGYPLPNTFYAKDGPFMLFVGKGLKYSYDFLLTSGVWVFIFIFLFPFFSPKKQRKLFLIPLSVILFSSVYITYVGGDHMTYSRFYVPYIPLFLLLVFSGAWHMGDFFAGERKGIYRLIPYALIAIVFCSMVISSKYYADKKYEKEYASMRSILDVRKEFGLWLRKNYSSNTVLAVSALGIVPYYSEMRSIDMVGLADVHIAHMKMKPGDYDQVIAHIKYDSDYILSRKPDLVPILTKFYLDYTTIDTGTIINDAMTFGWKAPSDLIWKREFRFNYAPRLAQLKSGAEVAYFERIPPLPDWKELAKRGVTSPDIYLELADRYTKHFLLIEAADARRFANDLMSKQQKVTGALSSVE